MVLLLPRRRYCRSACELLNVPRVKSGFSSRAHHFSRRTWPRFSGRRSASIFSFAIRSRIQHAHGLSILGRIGIGSVGDRRHGAFAAPAANQVEKITIAPARGASEDQSARSAGGRACRRGSNRKWRSAIRWSLEVQLGTSAAADRGRDVSLGSRAGGNLLQSGYTYRPIVYFQPAMKLRAKRLNVVL